MTLRRAAKIPLGIGIAASALVVTVFYIYVQQNFVVETAKTEQAKIALANTLASKTELRIQNEANALELAARMPAMQSTDFATLINEELKGIPPDADPEKRAVQKGIFEEFGDFESVGFVLANGDVYSVEPSKLQRNLPTLNFAYRDYFIKTIETRQTYVSEVFRSTATNHNTVVISTPVFRGEEIVAVLVGAINLDAINSNLRALELDNNEVAVYVDSTGLEIASSEPAGDSPVTARSFSYLSDSIPTVFTSDTGTATVTVDGTPTHITYAPLELQGSRWTVLLIQPEADAFSEAYLNQTQAVIIAAIVIAVMIVTEYILFRAMHHNMQLSDKLEKVNDALKNANRDLDLKAEELLKVDIAKEEFAAMITHELKTPLVPIIGFSELLADGTLGELSPIQKEKVSMIHNNAVSLANLITDLLDVRKLELKKMKFDFEKTSAREFIERAVESIRPLAESKKTALTYQIEDGKDGDLEVVCDAKRVRQVLYNLLSNAIKFVPEKTGKVEVSARKVSSDSSIEFAVRDNGIGIPKEKQQELFKKFYQVDTSLRRKAGGTGLGLAISKGIVEAHGGRIWFESMPGSETTFYFSIPESPIPGNGGSDSK